MYAKFFRQSSLVLAMSLVMATAGGAAQAGGDRVECGRDSAAGDSSIDARFEDKGDREKFSSSFEAVQGGGHMDGDVLQIKIDGETVGNITLAVLAGGDLGGDLNFDTTAGPGDADSPFPANWPGAGAGTIVSVGTLGCSLQNR